MKRFLGIFLALVLVFSLMASSTTVRAASIFTVININDSGSGSLRQAILDANDTLGTDTIEFNIPDPGPHTIQPLSALPTITDPVIIDGYTQPGSSPNTNGPGLGINAVLMVELDGSNAGFGANGLYITAGSSTVRGLVINRFSGNGIPIWNNGSNVIEGNYIGTNITGTAELGNNGNGVVVGFYISNNTIGGTTAEARNVISGNDGTAVLIYADDSLIQGNFIGTDLTGTLALSNGTGSVTDGAGVSIGYGLNNTIGGTTPEERNIISGNDGIGVFLGHLCTGNMVQGNYIGTDVTGTAALGNNGSGVAISGSNNTIGGTTAGAGNVISGNGDYGIITGGSENLIQGNFIGTDATGTSPLGNNWRGVFMGGVNNTIGGTTAGAGNVISGNNEGGVCIYGSNANGIAVLSNSIFANTGLGIDLGRDGVTPNDMGDGDSGPNNLQNFPTLTSVTTGSSTTIEGTLNSTPNTEFRLEFFSNSVYDPSTFGEGETFIGSTMVTTDGNGNASFSVTFPDVVDSQFVTATATDPDGNTSEFSQCFGLGGPKTFIINTVDDIDDGICDETHCSLREAINWANVNPGGDTIEFDIPGSGPHTIQPLSSLPTITDPLVIDGYSQPGASPNTNHPDLGLNTVLMIEMDGSNAGGSGLYITAGKSEVRGLVINGFALSIALETNGGNVIEGNFVGCDVTGTTVRSGLWGTGIFIGGSSGWYPSSNNTIGGTTAESRNLISGNGAGILIQGSGSVGNVIQGNLIGTDITGTVDLGNGSSGVRIYSANNTIGGTTTGARNVISGNDDDGVSIRGTLASGNTMQGNLIGTDVTGTVALRNSRHGVLITAPRNIVGGTTPEARNIISGNKGSGISIGGPENGVQGNFIGTDITGTIAIGNGDGVNISSSNNIIGGTTPGAGNLISGNLWNGVIIYAGAGPTLAGNLVQGNYIGTDVTGTADLGNSGNGITISRRGSHNTIGGTTYGEGNTIAYNGDDGVSVSPGTGNAILSNSIFSNGGLGIDLGNDGVTPNDVGDGDTGSNNLQNYPVVTSAISGSTTIDGTLNSTPNTQFRLEFFSNGACDPSGYGEGENFLGSTDVTTDGSGNVSFVSTFPGTAPSGQFVTVTATDPDGNTSEFSQCVEVTAGNGGVPNGDNGDDYITVGGTIIQVDKFRLMMPWIIPTALVLLAITSLALWMKKNKME